MLQIEIEQLPTYRIGMEKGKTEGSHDRAVAVARKLLAKEMPVAQIAEITELPVDVVEKLSREDS